MISGDFKMYGYVKISKPNFFVITMLSLHIHNMRSDKKSTLLGNQKVTSECRKVVNDLTEVVVD